MQVRGPIRVDTLLPQDVLLIQGKYVQTCAQIEKVLWHILRTCRGGFDFEDAEELKVAVRARRRHDRLIEDLRHQIREQRVADDADALTAILDEIERDIMNRHMAVLGAWHQQEDGTLVCEYFWNV